MTISLFFLFSIIGLTVDLGFSYSMKVSAQAAADSAAMAAAMYANSNGFACTTNILCNSTYTCPSTPPSPDDALKAGCLYASINGFSAAGGQTVTMTANNTATPNESGNTPALWIQANVSQTIPHLFLFWSGFQSGTVATQAISAVTVTPNGGCVYVLDTANTQDALVVSGAGHLTAISCGIYVNSSNLKAFEGLGGTAVVTASKISVHGNYVCSGGATCSPTPTTGTAVVSDPLASLPAPPIGTCIGSTATTPYTTSTGGSITQGTYCGGITVSGGTLTLASGTYILNGGGITIQGAGQLQGNNVMFYLTGSAGRSPGPMKLQGGAVNLTAPSSGSYQGILFFQDHNQSYSAKNVIQGNVTVTGSGTFYFPNTTLTVSGSTSANAKFGFVVWDLTVTGAASITQDTTGVYTGLARRSPGLIQ